MKALEIAFVKAIKSNSSLWSSLTGGIHNLVAPEGTATPYMVFQQISAVDHYTFSVKTHTEYLYMFRIIGTGLNKESLLDILDKLDGLFTLQSLTLESTSKRVERIERESIQSEQAEEAEGIIWLQVGANYRFTIYD